MICYVICAILTILSVLFILVQHCCGLLAAFGIVMFLCICIVIVGIVCIPIKNNKVYPIVV